LKAKILFNNNEPRKHAEIVFLVLHVVKDRMARERCSI